MIVYYLLVLIVSFLLAGVMAIRDVALLVALLTFGLGLPIIFSATAFVYSLCLFPAVTLWPLGSSGRWFGGALSVAAIAAIAFMPGYLDRERVRELTRALERSDLTPAQPIHARTLEIRRSASDYYDTFMDQEACGYECRATLISAQVDWVRVVMLDGGRTSAVYKLLRGKDCAASETIKSESANCVVMAQDAGAPAELELEFGLPSAAGPYSEPSRLAASDSIKRVTALLRRNGRIDEIYHQTELGVDVVMIPTVVGPTFEGMRSEGVAFVRQRQRVNRISLTETLARLGFSVAPSPDANPIAAKSTDRGVDERMTRELIAVLDLPQSEAFNGQQTKPIFDWLDHARGVKDWTPELLGVLKRIARDRRLRSPTFFDQIFERNPTVAQALMPDILEMIAVDGIGPDYTVARNVVRLAPSFLAPYAPQIIALLDRGREVREILLPAIGRIGVDPAPYLLPFDADLDHQTAVARNPRLQGACYAEKRWAPELIPALQRLVPTTIGRDRRRVLFSALANLGDRAFVAQALAADTRPDESKLSARIDSLMNDTRMPDAVCSML